MLDTVSSMHSLPVLLLAMETSCTTQTTQAVARWPPLEIILLFEDAIYLTCIYAEVMELTCSEYVCK